MRNIRSRVLQTEHTLRTVLSWPTNSLDAAGHLLLLGRISSGGTAPVFMSGLVRVFAVR